MLEQIILAESLNRLKSSLDNGTKAKRIIAIKQLENVQRLTCFHIKEIKELYRLEQDQSSIIGQQSLELNNREGSRFFL